MSFKIAWLMIKDIYPIKYHMKTKKKENILRVIGLLGVLLGLFFLYGLGSYMSFMITPYNQKAEVVLGNAYVIGIGIILIFGTLHLIYYLNYADDYSVFITLPLKAYQIILSKIMVVIVMEGMIVIPIILIPTFIYGMNMTVGVLFWLKSLILLVILICTPIICISSIILVTMKFINWKKFKELISGLFLIFFLTVTMKFLIEFRSFELDNLGTSILDKGTIVYKLVSQYIDFVVGESFGIGLWGAFLIMLIVVIGMICCENYIQMILEVTSNLKNTMHKNVKDYIACIKSNSILPSLIIKEYKLLLREPTFLFNGGNVAIMVIIGAIVLKIINPTLLKGISTSVGSEWNASMMYLMIFLLGVICSTHIIAITSFSREKSMLEYLNTEPIVPEKIIYAKTIVGISISSIYLIIILLLIYWMLGIRILQLFIIGLGSLGIIGLMNYYYVLSDYRMPKLDWKEPYELIKVNMNLVKSTCKSIGFLSIYGILIVGYSWIKGQNLKLLIAFIGVLAVSYGILRHCQKGIIKEKVTGVLYDSVLKNTIFYSICYLVVQIILGIIISLILFKRYEYDTAMKIYEKQMLNILLLSQIITCITLCSTLRLKGKSINKYCKINQIKVKEVYMSIVVGFNMYLLVYIVIGIFKLNSISVTFSERINSILGNHSIVGSVLVIGITSAITEEIIFRGLILNELKRRMDYKCAIIIQAIIFGLYHMNLKQAIYGVLSGCILGEIVHRSDSIFKGIIVHCVFNILGVSLFYIGSNTRLLMVVVGLYSGITISYIIQFVINKRVKCNKKSNKEKFK